MTGRSMGPSDASQVARFLRGDEIVDNDCDLVLYSILDR